MPLFCKLVIPNTFITCGEGSNYCSQSCLFQSEITKALLSGRGSILTDFDEKSVIDWSNGRNFPTEDVQIRLLKLLK